GGHGVWANLRDVTVVVQDDQAPSVSPKRGALLDPGWHRGYGEAWGAYADNTGIRQIALQVDGTTYQSQDFGDPGWAALGVQCDYALAVPCHNLGDGGLGLDTHAIADGQHTLRQAGEWIRALRGIAVPDQGDWTLRVWLADAAGNADPGHASDPVHVRFDPAVDGAVFAAPDRGDPRRLVALVSDRVSGVAPGTIELRRRGTEAWRALPTALAGAEITALVPDAELADGVYELRTLARDAAGNERIADRYADGS